MSQIYKRLIWIVAHCAKGLIVTNSTKTSVEMKNYLGILRSLLALQKIIL